MVESRDHFDRASLNTVYAVLLEPVNGWNLEFEPNDS